MKDNFKENSPYFKKILKVNPNVASNEENVFNKPKINYLRKLNALDAKEESKKKNFLTQSTLQNTLPNNRENALLFELNNKKVIKSNNIENVTSVFSNFTNYNAIKSIQKRQKSKFFDIYYPQKDKEEILKDENENKLIVTIKKEKLVNNFNLNTTLIQFNMDKVTYVKTLDKAKLITDLILEKSKMISINCDSDCFLQEGIDFFEVAVLFNMCIEHPDIYIFDVHLVPQIIEFFKPIFAENNIIKVMFDARFDLRVLSRCYGVNTFVGLFDVQLAYRVLQAKLSNRSFKQVKREKLLYISWQCNGPLINFGKLYLPGLYYLKNKKYWKERPVNCEMIYNAAYDVFVMIPQLFTNLMVIMERTLTDLDKQKFLELSNELIFSNLVARKFPFFRSKHDYLTEVHKQVDLLIQSDILQRAKNFSYKDLDKDQNHSIETEDEPINLETSLNNVCRKCNLKKRFSFNKILHDLNNKNLNLSRNEIFSGSKCCKCYLDIKDETKCMNLLVDQIIDLAETKEDYMEMKE